MHKITKQSPVTLVELPPTQFGILDGDASFDVYSKSKSPSRAIHVLEGVLRHDKWKNIESINPLYHGKNGKLTPENLKRIFNSDILLISSITRTSPQSIELTKNYKQINPEKIVIAGGPDPTFRIEDWLRYVDIVVKGEGEKTISELMSRLTEDTKSLEDIDGIAFKKGKEIITTKPRDLLTSEELSQLPHPFYDETTRENVSTAVVETSRGCPNDCDFCIVTKLYGRKYRTKSIDYVIEELKRTKDLGGFVFFTDDNLAASPKKTIKLLETIAERGLNKKQGVAQVTIGVADNLKLMKSIKNAGIKYLCIGIESINDKTLSALRKPYTAEQNKQAIKILKDYGFWIHGMMMFGEEGDNYETFKETLAWMNKNLDSMQLFTIVPVPGTPLYKRMEDENRILTKDWSLYDAHHVITRPKNFTPIELQNLIIEAYEDFYSVKNTLKRLKRSPDKKMTLEIMAYTRVFKIIKKVANSYQTQAHLEFLKSIS